MSDVSVPPAGDTVTGWKAIAAHFNRTERTVQRWERELGLPVHRVKSERGGTVYASRCELDEWLRCLDTSRLAGGETAGDLETRQSPGTLLLGTSRKVTGTIVLATAFLVVAVSVFAPRQTRPPREVRIAGTQIEALDLDGRTVWRHDIGVSGTVLHDIVPNPLFTDLDADGRNELMVAVARGAADRDVLRAGHVVFAFSLEGQLRWSHAESQFPFSFDGRQFDGPTRLLAWTADGEGHVWISVNHHTWWPTMLVRLDATGRAEVRYVQSGGIYVLTPWKPGDGKTYIVAGGVNNEFEEASVAVLDTQGQAATSPQTAGKGFHCDDCPSGAGLAAFFLFPRSDVGQMDRLNPYSLVEHLDLVGNDVRVSVSETPQGGTLNHLIVRGFGVQTVAPSDLFRHEHDLFERERRLDHSLARCPFLEELANVRVWKPASGWTVDALADPIRTSLPNR